LKALSKNAKSSLSKAAKTSPTKHGGKRKGAGRKLGSVKGRTVVSKTVAMAPESWAKLDRDRGPLPRGKYIESRL
jgi:hypothetical protein